MRARARVVGCQFLARNGDCFFITFASQATNVYARARDRAGPRFVVRHFYRWLLLAVTGTILLPIVLGQKLADRRGFFLNCRENPANFFARARELRSCFAAEGRLLDPCTWPSYALPLMNATMQQNVVLRGEKHP